MLRFKAEESTGPDVNTDAGYAEALAMKLGRDLTAEEREQIEALPPDRDVQSGLTEEPVRGPERDPDTGRFLPRQEEPKAEEATPPASEEEEPEQGDETPPEDPAVAAFLAKYDNDPDKAIKAAAALSSKIGEQGNEVGQLREQLAEMRGALQTLQQQRAEPEAPQAPARISSEYEAELEQTLADEGGPAMMMRVVRENPDHIEDALDIWKEYEYRAASRWERMYFEAFGEEEQPQQTQQADPFIQNLKLQTSLGQAVAAIHQEIGDGRFQVIKEHLVPALEEAPKIIVELVMSEDQTAQREGFKALTSLAEARAVRVGTVSEKKTAEAAAARKAAAQVAPVGQRPAAPATDASTSEEDRQAAIKRFKEGILESPSTDVEMGLTFGK